MPFTLLRQKSTLECPIIFWIYCYSERSGELGALQYILGVSWPPTPKDIPEPSHGRVYREKFRSVHVVKCVWSLLKDLFFNRKKKHPFSAAFFFVELMGKKLEELGIKTISIPIREKLCCVFPFVSKWLIDFIFISITSIDCCEIWCLY